MVILAVRRKLSALGVVSVALFGLGVLVSWVSGGNTLAEELQDPALFGLFGVACLVSVAVGHPLHQIILRAMGRSNPRYTQTADRAAAAGPRRCPPPSSGWPSSATPSPSPSWR